MRTELTRLKGLSRADRGRAAQVLARAFAEDRLFTDYYFIDAGPRYDAYLVRLMLYAMQHGLLFGEVYATSPLYEGIAIWYPPTYTGPTTWKDVRAGGISLLLQTGRAVVDRMSDHLTYSAGLWGSYVPRSPLPGAERWLLWILAVDPEHQKQGYASRLLRPMLGRLDREGCPCCLDTQNADNLPLYAHYGFEIVSQGHIPGTSIPHWLLERQPGAVEQVPEQRA